MQFISSNKEVFKKFVTFLSLEEHLKKMLMCNTWATQVEINAAASFLQIPLYICTQRTMSLLYYWELYKPLHCKPLGVTQKFSVYHVELAHVERCHYEVITMDGSLPLHPPKLDETTTFVDLT